MVADLIGRVASRTLRKEQVSRRWGKVRQSSVSFNAYRVSVTRFAKRSQRHRRFLSNTEEGTREKLGVRKKVHKRTIKENTGLQTSHDSMNPNNQGDFKGRGCQREIGILKKRKTQPSLKNREGTVL